MLILLDVPLLSVYNKNTVGEGAIFNLGIYMKISRKR